MLASSHFLGSVAWGWVQESVHDVWPDFRCHVILHLFCHQIVLAELTHGLLPPSLHGKYQVQLVMDCADSNHDHINP